MKGYVRWKNTRQLRQYCIVYREALYIYMRLKLMWRKTVGGFRVQCTMYIYYQYQDPDQDQYQVNQESLTLQLFQLNRYRRILLKSFIKKCFEISIFLSWRMIKTLRTDLSEVGESFGESQPTCCCGPQALAKRYQGVAFW